ncbi:MAG: hypothetical protein Q8Q48_00475 [Candidatus Staskawiczbacteria bacterium]|nr:hypothetical protein [Candidatus Staskawiczbacteria bacterium]
MEKEPQAENFEGGREERVGQLVRLFEVGLDSKDCIGYHGTSLEAIEFMIENGHLPGGKFKHIDSGENWLYFSPKEPMRDDYKGKGVDQLEDAKGYAEDIAQSHFLLKQLGLDIENKNLEIKARYLATNDPNDPHNPDAEYNFFIGLGIDKKLLDSSIKKARKRKGIVLGLSKKGLSDQTILPGDGGGEDMRVYVPNGLSIDFLSGLEPLGDEEWDYFEKFQNEE